MSPWLNRTLHPQLAPRMNLRVHSGHCNLGIASGAFLAPVRRFTIGKPTMNSPTESLTYAFYHASVAVPTSYRAALCVWAQYLCTLQSVRHVHRAACYGFWLTPTWCFRKAPRLEPPASRAQSVELYVVALGFKK
jgi:hypothetical protein